MLRDLQTGDCFRADHLIESITPNNVAAQIANVHTIFNITTTLLLLPIGTKLVDLATNILP